MIVDGKQIANNIYEKLRAVIAQFPDAPNAGIVIVGSDPVIESFVRLKKNKAKSIGVNITEHRYPETITEEELINQITRISKDPSCDGLVIQLPLPKHLAVQKILDAVPVEKDVDVLSTTGVAQFAEGKGKFLPPVAGAVKEILDHVEVSVAGEEVLILGYGRLVGIPVSILMRHNGAHVTVIDRPVSDLRDHVRESALIISGTGNAGLITPGMLTGEQILIDAGTSESKGKVVGDADPGCSQIAKYFTPVPGGVGPITVAVLLRNICIAARKRIV